MSDAPAPTPGSGAAAAGSGTSPCPACGKAARGRYCSHCGAQLEPAACSQCDALLQPGDKYCFECGARVMPPEAREAAIVAPAAAIPARSRPVVADDADDEDDAGVAVATRSHRSKLPWLIGTGAVVAVIGIATWRSMQEQRFEGDAAQAAQAVGVQQGPMAAPPAGAPAGADAGNPLALEPSQQADRMYDRIMRLASEGKKDSVQFFAPIAFQIYGAMGPLDLDQHYDLGNVAHTAGMDDVARAQADTILAADPSHLLGLALRFRASVGAGQLQVAKVTAEKLIASEKSEKAKAAQKQEYERHSSDIDLALIEARKLLQ